MNNTEAKVDFDLSAQPLKLSGKMLTLNVRNAGQPSIAQAMSTPSIPAPAREGAQHKLRSGLSLRVTQWTCDKTGRECLRYTPVFSPDIRATGELTFAFWEAWKDEPETHVQAKVSALANARVCLASFATPELR